MRNAAFRRIVANAPNLRHVSLIVSRQVSLLSAEEQEELDEAEIKFEVHKRPNDSIRSLALDGYSLSQSTLDYWSHYVDLKKLERFKCSRGGRPEPSYFTIAPNILTNLKHVSLNLGGFQRIDDENLNAAMVNYIATCAPLTSLSLWSWKKAIPLSTILAQHGATLEILDLHERETVAISSTRYVLGVDELIAIRDACPRLNNLTMDINRCSKNLQSEKPNLDVYAELALYKLLDRLQVYFDLGTNYLASPLFEPEDSDDENQEGSTHEDASGGKREKLQHLPPTCNRDIERHLEQMWTVVFAHRNTGARRLDVKFGELEAKGFSPWADDERRHESLWHVRPHERDDRKGKCVVDQLKGGIINEDGTWQARSSGTAESATLRRARRIHGP